MKRRHLRLVIPVFVAGLRESWRRELSIVVVW